MKSLIPPTIVTLVFLFVIFFTKDLFRFSVTLPSSLGFIIIFAGLVIIFIAANQFKAANTTINPIKPENASVLVSKGIFSYSRNPMYLGMLIILLSLSFKFNLAGGILISLFFYSFITKFQILPEEEAMNELFGDEFIEYSNRTRRWI